MNSMETFQLTPIGYIRSPYKQKFAIPRQPRLVPDALARLEFTTEFSREEFVRGIEDFSHVWVIFRFHETADKGFSALVRPPRLGGNAKKGVFATRATFRPNSIGMSAVKLESVEYKNGKLALILSGIDLLDGTPVLDIKPYLPYSDSLEHASAGFADTRPFTDMEVSFSSEADAFLAKLPNGERFKRFIEQVLLQDPRPAYKAQKDPTQHYGMTLDDYNIKWQVTGNRNLVTEIRKTTNM